jgi:hypothetical protein
MAMKIFKAKGFPWFWDFLLEYAKIMRLTENSYFEFIGQFYFQNDVFKLIKIFSKLGIRVFLENGLGSFQPFLILQI